MTMSLTKASTILPKAAPMMTPIARLSALPLSANSLNSFHIGYRPWKADPDCLRQASRALPRDKAFRPGEAAEKLYGSRRRGASALALLRRGFFKHHRVEPALAHGQAEISEAKKRDQRDKQNDRDADKARQTGAGERRHALGQRFSSEQSFDRLLEDMGDEEEDRQEEAFIEDGIDQRSLAKPTSGVKDLERNMDLGKEA